MMTFPPPVTELVVNPFAVLIVEPANIEIRPSVVASESLQKTRSPLLVCIVAALVDCSTCLVAFKIVVAFNVLLVMPALNSISLSADGPEVTAMFPFAEIALLSIMPSALMVNAPSDEMAEDDVRAQVLAAFSEINPPDVVLIADELLIVVVPP